MIGGIVVETIVLSDCVWVNCVDANERRNNKCAIYVERSRTSEAIKPGDSLWWQGGRAMWTPYENRGKPDNKAGKDYDIQLRKIGFSGVSRPPANRSIRESWSER